MVSKWNRFSSSIFTVMTQEARKAGAVNLAQGFPDFDGPIEIKAAAKAAIDGPYNQYAPSAGYPELRQAIARYYQPKGMKYSPEDEITIFAGATEALFCTFLALLDRDDEVIGFEPFYDSYPAGVFAAGAVFKTVPLESPNWSFDPERLRATITKKTRAIILNTPHNPTGHVFSLEELTIIQDLVCKHDLFLITDEVYEELVYAPHKHHHAATLSGMRERTIVISSTGKTFSLTGWKVGYAFAPKAITDALRAVHQFMVFSSASPMQIAMIRAFELPGSYADELRRFYGDNRDTLAKILTSHGFKCHKPDGTYFLLADYSALSDLSDIDFSLWMTQEIKVACVPTSVFYLDPSQRSSQRLVRFAFCKKQETLKEAERNLQRLAGIRAPTNRL